MTNDKPVQYLVRTSTGHDYGRHTDYDQCAHTADMLGKGSVVILLDDFLLPVRDSHTGEVLVVYTAR